MLPTVFIVCLLVTLAQVHAVPVADISGQQVPLLEDAAVEELRLGGHRPIGGDTVIINVDVDQDSTYLTDIDTGHGGRPGHGGYGPSHG